MSIGKVPGSDDGDEQVEELKNATCDGDNIDRIQFQVQFSRVK